jgi:methylated-DNA-[protein]-cysteine S-methyltransferase
MKKTTYESPLGQMIILADNNALYGLWFADQKYCGGKFDLSKFENGQTVQSKKASAWLDQYFAGQAPTTQGINLQPQATSFQKAVFHELLKVPCGETTTYKDLAVKLNSSPRAVGNAVARNQILLLIPCHRVLGTDGALTGYAGGLTRKRALLKLEGSLHN